MLVESEVVRVCSAKRVIIVSSSHVGLCLIDYGHWSTVRHRSIDEGRLFALLLEVKLEISMLSAAIDMRNVVWNGLSLEILFHIVFDHEAKSICRFFV